MIRVKICGVNDVASFDTVVEEGADYVGFVFFPPSPRFITPTVAASLSARSEAGPKRVALLVDPSDDALRDMLAVFTPDILQLNAAAERVAAIRATFGIPVWRALGVTTASDLPQETAGADAMLIESKPPKDATRPGGNAVSFDWSILAGWKPGFDWLLAGGLNPDNVAEAVRIGQPPGVDVSSGVESSPGVKDPARIRAFIRAARSW